MREPYYMAYEQRYKAVYSAGVERWGHQPTDEVLYNTLKAWVEENSLKGKKIIEYACGEGACGVILSELGCIYHGVDISPSAVDKSKKFLTEYPDATVEVLDMVKERVNGKYDAALDCMGLHMLITDIDRKNYLQNACSALKEGAPMLFFRESYRDDAPSCRINTIDEWAKLTESDYSTLQPRQVKNESSGEITEVMIPLLPARAKNKAGYVKEFEDAGFFVVDFKEMDSSSAIPHSATVWVRKK